MVRGRDVGVSTGFPCDFLFFLVLRLSLGVLFDAPVMDRTSEIQNGDVTISNTRAAKNPRNTANSPALIPAETRM